MTGSSSTQTTKEIRGWNFRPIMAEALLAMVVALVAAFCAWWVLFPLGSSSRPFNWSPPGRCISMAAGYVMPIPPPGEQIPELDAYLNQDVSTFDLSLLPEPIASERYGYFSPTMHFYLEHCVALAYRLFGVSRWSILVLCGFLHVLCAVILYGVFRLGMGRVLSFAGGILNAASPSYLTMCSEVRDYGKAPWILAVILILGILIRFRHGGKGLLAYSAVLGTIMGIGIGFRQDVLIGLPAALVVVLAIARVNGPRAVLWRLSASVSMVLLFTAVGLPVLTAKEDESVAGHTLLQGLASENEQMMAFGDASYEFNMTEFDPYCVALAQSYAKRTENLQGVVLDRSPAYGRVSLRMFLDIAALCPADQFSRGLAALVVTPRLLISSWAGRYPARPESDQLNRLIMLHTPIDDVVVRYALPCVVLGFVFLGMYNLRVALGVAFLFAFFGAYPSLLYVYRHAFHLSFIPYWFAGFCLSFLGQGIRNVLLRRKRCSTPEEEPATHLLKRLGRGLGFVLVSALLALGVLGALLMVQRANLVKMVARYANAQLEPLTVEQVKTNGGVLFSLPTSISEMQGKPILAPGDTASDYIVAVFRGPHPAIGARILYDERYLADFSQDVTIPSGDGLRFYFPALEGRWDGDAARFRGLLVPNEAADQVEGLYRVVDSEKFRLWPFLMLPDKMGDFVWSKKGPLEKTLLAVPLELKNVFGWSGESVLDGYLKLARQYPSHLPFIRRAFGLAAQSGKLDEVKRVWETVLRNKPGKLSEGNAFVGCLDGDTVFTPAEVRWLLRALKDRWTPPPKQITARNDALLIEQGANLARQGNFDAARAAFRTVVDNDPGNVFAHQALSDLYLAAGDFEGLEREWRDVLHVHPGRAQAYHYLAMALDNQGDAEGAITAYERALILGPCNLATKGELARIRNDLARDLLAEAHELADSGNYEEALRLFKRLRETQATDPGPSPAEAYTLVQAGRAEEAKAAFREMIEHAPDDYVAYESLSQLYLSAGDLSGLKEEWRAAVQKYPDRAWAHFSLGLALENQGDLDGAIQAYEATLRQEPQAATIQEALARTLQAKTRILSDSGNDEEARRLFERLRETQATAPGQSPPEVDTPVKEEQTEEAKAAYREIIDHAPHGYEAYDALSELYLTTGDLRGLEEEWRTAVKKNPDRALAHFSLGLALERQDKLDGAIRAYEDALRKEPQATGTREALMRALQSKINQLTTSGKTDELNKVRQRLQSLVDPAPATPKAVEENAGTEQVQEEGKAALSAAQADNGGVYPLWRGTAIPSDPEAIPLAEGMEHRTVHDARQSDYKFLHGAAIICYQGTFFADWANSPMDENFPRETLQGRRATDPLGTWSALEVIGPGFDGPERHSHGIFLPHDGRLWAFAARFGVGAAGKHFPGLKAEAFVLNEAGDHWDSQGIAMDNCWPYDQPVRMVDGNYITGGQDKDGLPVVAISHGYDVTQWDTVAIPYPPELEPSFAETTVWAEGQQVLAVIRGGGGVAWCATSDDCGRTWAQAMPSNYPMPRAKAYLGKLSTGQLYLLANYQNRDTLVVSVGRPGEMALSAMWRIRAGPSEPPRFEGRAKSKQWSYPYGYEHEGKLYVVYSIGKEDCGLSVIPIRALAVEAAKNP